MQKRSFLCKVVPWSLETAPKAMGILASSCQACSLPTEGWNCREEEPLGPSAGQKENCMAVGCLGEEGGPAGIGFSSPSPVKFALVSCRQCQSSGALTHFPVSSYLSHTCLQDLEPCLCFQFRLHQPCREDIGQALSSPRWSPPHVMLCQVAGKAHVGLGYFQGSISHGPRYILLGLELGPGSIYQLAGSHQLKTGSVHCAGCGR